MMLPVMPSDHVIDDLDAFHRAVTTGAVVATDGALVTLGINPTGPEISYGYIEAGATASCRVSSARWTYSLARKMAT